MTCRDLWCAEGAPHQPFLYFLLFLYTYLLILRLNRLVLLSKTLLFSKENFSKRNALWALACQLRGLLECAGAFYVLYAMWMILPNQAGSLQGFCGASHNILAANDLGTGSGW